MENGELCVIPLTGTAEMLPLFAGHSESIRHVSLMQNTYTVT